MADCVRWWRAATARSGRIIGFGCRSLRDVYINGEARTVGYLSSLRVLPAYRNIGLVARGYAFFRRLHREDGSVPLLPDDNRRGKRDGRARADVGAGGAADVSSGREVCDVGRAAASAREGDGATVRA